MNTRLSADGDQNEIKGIKDANGILTDWYESGGKHFFHVL